MENSPSRLLPSHHRRNFVADRFGGNYAPLLVALVLLYAVAPLLTDHYWTDRLLDGLFYATVLVGARGATGRPAHLITVVALAMLGMAASALGDRPGRRVLSIVGDLGNAALLIGLCVLILRDILRHPRVRIDTIFGSLCVYLLISLIASFLYLALDTANPNAFRGINAGDNDLADLLYFSVTTLATLGYGDITPRTQLARSLATIEALAGQLYLVVLVAHLVGLRLSQQPPDTSPPADHPPRE
ncbi:MAG: potassium channel family protein [Dehalococcoidia bacterium]